MSYTTQEEQVIEGAYSDFFSAVEEGKFEEAESVKKEMESLEYYSVALDMGRLLAHKKMYA